MGIKVTGEARITDAASEETVTIKADELDWQEVAADKRPMGTEIQYEAVVDHDILGKVSWNVWEYPEGVLNMTKTDVGHHTLEQDFVIELESRPGIDEDF